MLPLGEPLTSYQPAKQTKENCLKRTKEKTSMPAFLDLLSDLSWQHHIEDTSKDGVDRDTHLPQRPELSLFNA